MYANITLPLAVDTTYSYSIPEAMLNEVRVGVRVVVPLGIRKYYTGIVSSITEVRPNFKTVKPISSVVDKEPIVTPRQIEFWTWLADYYMCSVGEVMKAAMPSSLKAQGFSEDIEDKYAAKTETHISLYDSIDNEQKMSELLDSLKRAPNQQTIILALIEAGNPLPKSKFKDSTSAIKSLQSKGLIKFSEVEVSRYKRYERELSTLPQLTENQQLSLNVINDFFDNKTPTLLHGVTGSGKTEIYIHLIADTISKGRDALYLLPEIALTSQLIERLQNYFGDNVVVYHSRFGDAMRAECYMRLLQHDRPPLVILGVRSSLLLPHSNLGVVIVDEEHENSYKQQDPAPRYHARDAAIVLAAICGAGIVLGSATPSVESYFNAVTGKYGLVTLSERYGGVSMPQILISDTISAAKRGEKISHFSTLLLKKIDQAILDKKQVILFQNRRGFSPYVECADCSATISCPNCNVSLTYHKINETLVCHYCGHTISMPEKCPTCASKSLKPMGFGTEKVEEELQKIMPEAVIGRLDTDSARSARGYTRVISEFSAGRIDVLVGTQMVSKGFDFENVSLVGILNADNILNVPDFRAIERSYQLMTQVAGRAGRRDVRGEVVIQTSQPSSPVISQIKISDYEGMFRSQISERQRFLYPPFCRIIQFTFKHTQKPILANAAADFEHRMKQLFGTRLLGPETPPVDKIRNEYLCRFILKIEKERSFARAKKMVAETVKEVSKSYGSLIISVDVDPQ